MSFSHISALQRRHREIERRIQAELSHVAWDESALRRMKEQKLHLRDEIYAMQRTGVANR